MQKNDIYEIQITGMTDDGCGVGRLNGFAVFVPYTIVGETVRIVLIKVLKSYAVGKLIEVIKPSEHRTKSLCKNFYQCGGCALWHMSYDEELKFKKQKVADCLTRIAKLKNPRIENVVAADSFDRYRNKSQFPVTENGIGMYAAHSHRLIEMNDCLIASKAVKPIINSVRYWMKQFSVPAYNEHTGHGLIRNIYIRGGRSGSLVTIVTAKRELYRSKELIDELRACGTPICGIVQNVNVKNTNTILGSENKTLYGSGFLKDDIGGIEFEISPLSFYQVNKPQTKKLYQIAKECAGLTGSETLLDLYCGIGTIGLFMSDKVRRIIGIETSEAAVRDARRNAEINNITNAEYYSGKAEELIDLIKQKNYAPDVAVLDPPRKGCGKKLLSLRRIVYISCKPSTLARDIEQLAEYGFFPQRIIPVDMFPRTPHVETVVLLTKI